MKPNHLLTYLFFFTLFCNIQIFSQSDLHKNNITIRNDRVFMLNGQPFFPIMVNHEMDVSIFNQELKKPLPDGTLWGFNIINLHLQTHGAFDPSCWGRNMRNCISGDLNSGSQYFQLLNPMGWNISYQDNANRLFNYTANVFDPAQNVYLLSDCHAFFTDPYPYYIVNENWIGCNDLVEFQPRYNQTVRNNAIDRINSLALQSNSQLIGFFSLDDANMFNLPQTWNGYDKAQYYLNNKNEHFENLQTTYQYAKSVYPNSIVYINFPPIYYPRANDYPNWQNQSLCLQNWKNDAFSLVNAGDVIGGGFVDFELWAPEWKIFNSNGYPDWYLNYLNTMFNEIFPLYDNHKALLGGQAFDNPDFFPLPSDPKFNDKMKWATYVSLAKGATGLSYFGWHFYNIGNSSFAWDYVKRMVDTLANVKNLDQNVFTKTNSGEVGHSVSGSMSQNLDYAVYKINNWNEYYMLVVNNPNGSYRGIDEGNNLITFNGTSVNLCYYDVKEVFSENTVTTSSNQFQYTLPWFGTALFHIKLKEPLANCGDEIELKKESNIPDIFFISQNYPNPFNPETEISFGLPKDEFVTIEVYNSLGQKVTTLMHEHKAAGVHNIKFEGHKYASGMYIYKIKAGSFTETKKMLLIK